MVETFKEFLASKISKFPKYLTLIIIQYLLMAAALAIYVEDLKVTNLLKVATPSLVIIYLSVFASFYLYYYYNSGKTESPRTSVILAVLGALIVFSWFGYMFVYNSHIPDEAVTLLSISITAILAICWWIIRHEQSKLASKKNHTLNILLQSRLSSTYQEKLADVALLFPAGSQITTPSGLKTEEGKKLHSYFMLYSGMMVESDVTIELPDGTTLDITDELSKKARAIKSMGYLLNYFEFLAVGIKKDDIHEPLIKDCLLGIVRSLRTTAAQLIEFKRETDADTWCNFVEMCDRWCGPLETKK